MERKGVKSMRTKEEILSLVEEEDVEFIRLQFTDMFGRLKNVAITAGQLERVLDKNYEFDASNMFGMLQEDEEYMYLRPDLDTFVILPWRPQQGKVARMLCDICKEDGSLFVKSPRSVLKNVLDKAQAKGYSFYIDPECEFFLFHTDENGIPTTVTHEQAGFMDVGPIDMGENPRRDMVLALEDMGFEIESSHHETAPGQQEIDFQEGKPLQIADSVVTFKSAVRSIAKRFGLHATFMPKPKEGVAGSGMHINISVYKDDRSIFNEKDAKGVRDEARWFIGGIMKHAKGICAISNPLVNSYKRLLSGFDAPKDIVWAKQKINALVKVRSRKFEDTKVELRFPDPSANPYLLFALCIEAGILGIEEKIEPGDMAPLCYENGSKIDKLPATLSEAVAYMEKDSLISKVLGEEFTKDYATAKKEEWKEYMIQVSDWEINKYMNCM